MSQDETSIPGPGGGDGLEKDFVAGLEKDGLELGGKKAPVEAPKPAAEPEKPAEDKDPKKPEEGKPTDSKEKDKDPKDPAKPAEVEPWRKMIAKKRQDKARAADGKDPAKPEPESAKPDPLKPDPSKKEEPKTPELTKEQKEFSEKYGIEEADLLKIFPPAQVKEIIKEGMSEEDKATLEQFRQNTTSTAIEQGYSKDFDTNVLPLIEAEYPGISKSKIAEIKQSIRAKLDTDQFALTPLDVIYRGDGSFRGVVNTPKKGVDEGRTVPTKDGSGKVWDFETATEEDVKSPGFPFQEYSDYMAKKEKKK